MFVGNEKTLNVYRNSRGSNYLRIFPLLSTFFSVDMIPDAAVEGELKEVEGDELAARLSISPSSEEPVLN